MRALVVDDDIVSRMAMSDLLCSFGSFDVVEADDGDAAWDILDNGLRPIICCCDVRMQRVSGIDLLKRVKARPDLADMPFVLVSSASDRETIRQAVQLGAAGYILKPFRAAVARIQLEKVILTSRDKVAENPAATMRRLNIVPAKLVAYCEAFQKQIIKASGDLQEALNRQDQTAAKSHIDLLHTGCITLGLWYAGELIDRVRRKKIESDDLEITLKEVIDAVMHQAAQVRTPK